MSERMACAVELDHLVLRCADVEAARAFYEAIGLVFAKERHGAGPEHFACTLGEFVLELYPASGRPTASVRIGLRVGDVRAVVERVREAGGCVVRAEGAQPTALVRDPDGNDIALSSVTLALSAEDAR